MLNRSLTRLATPVLRASSSSIRAPLAARASLSTSATRKAASADHGHDSHYDPPGGWLWGVRPGEKTQREGWEIPFYIMCGMYVVAAVAYGMKEDTSIQTWALEEARRRLEAEGILEDTNASGDKP